MPRLTPQHWKKLVCVFEKCGFVRERTSGSHIVMSKSGVARPLIVPKYTEISTDIISGLIRTAGLTRKQYFQRLGEC